MLRNTDIQSISLLIFSSYLLELKMLVELFLCVLDKQLK